MFLIYYIMENKENTKLCVNMDCERYPPDWDFEEDTEDTYQVGQWQKCCLCDGYFDDDGLGDILFIESTISKGKGTLNMTGNLGKVMKESATIALEYIKSNAETLGLNQEIFEKYNVHIHVPEGATPKDGPSAGITMLTSLVSLFTQRKVKKSLAMTGEITLRGKVLPVGGIKEKILAAKRARIREILLCEENKRDIEEIKPAYLKGLTFHYVTEMSDVLALALTQEKVKGAKKL